MRNRRSPRNPFVSRDENHHMISPIRSGIPGSAIQSLPQLADTDSASPVDALVPVDSFEPATDELAQEQQTAPAADPTSALQALIAPLISALMAAFKSMFEKLTGNSSPSTDK